MGTRHLRFSICILFWHLWCLVLHIFTCKCMYRWEERYWHCQFFLFCEGTSNLTKVWCVASGCSFSNCLFSNMALVLTTLDLQRTMFFVNVIPMVCGDSCITWYKWHHTQFIRVRLYAFSVQGASLHSMSWRQRDKWDFGSSWGWVQLRPDASTASASRGKSPWYLWVECWVCTRATQVARARKKISFLPGVILGPWSLGLLT